MRRKCFSFLNDKTNQNYTDDHWIRIVVNYGKKTQKKQINIQYCSSDQSFDCCETQTLWKKYTTKSGLHRIFWSKTKDLIWWKCASECELILQFDLFKIVSIIAFWICAEHKAQITNSNKSQNYKKQKYETNNKIVIQLRR